MEITRSTERKSRITGLLWGMAKCGKTTFLTSLPGKKLFVMLDPDGDSSIPDDPNIDIVKLYEQPNDVIKRWLTDKLPALLAKNEQGYESLVVDSLSTFGQITLLEAIRNNVGAGPNFKPTLEAPGLAAYGARTNNLVDMVNKVLRATGSVGINCFFTAHEDEPTKDDRGNILSISVTLSGKATNGIGLNVSEIWFMRKHENKWFIAISPCRGRSPMGSRIFDVTKEPEFQLKFDPEKGTDQPHSIATWLDTWNKSGRKKLPIPT